MEKIKMEFLAKNTQKNVSFWKETFALDIQQRSWHRERKDHLFQKRDITVQIKIPGYRFRSMCATYNNEILSRQIIYECEDKETNKLFEEHHVGMLIITLADYNKQSNNTPRESLFSSFHRALPIPVIQYTRENLTYTWIPNVANAIANPNDEYPYHHAGCVTKSYQGCRSWTVDFDTLQMNASGMTDMCLMIYENAIDGDVLPTAPASILEPEMAPNLEEMFQ